MFERLQMCLRNRIRLSKRDGVSRTLLSPMWQVSVIRAEREIGMQSPKIRRRWLVEGFDIHFVVFMPIDLVDLYDALYASLYDGLLVC